MICHQAPISGVATYADQYVATAGYDNRVIIWDAKQQQALACGFHDHLANQCQFSPCGQYLVSSGSDYSARLWSVPDMRLISVLSGHDDDVEGVAFHPTDEVIATSSRDHAIHIYNFNGQLINVIEGHERDVLSVVWSKDSVLISSSDDGTVKYWHSKSGKLIRDIDLDGIETDTVVITPNDEVIVGNDLGEIILFKGEEKYLIEAHSAGIKRLCFNAEKSMLMSLSYDRSMMLWKLIDGQLKKIKQTNLPNIIWARSGDFLGNNHVVLSTFGSHYALYDYTNDVWDTSLYQDDRCKNAILVDKNNHYTIGDAGLFYKNNDVVQSLPSLCNFLVMIEGIILTGGQSGEVFNATTGEVIYQHRSPLNCGANFTLDKKDHVIIGSYTGEGIIFKKHEGNVVIVDVINLHENAIKGIAASDNYIFSVDATGAANFCDINDFLNNKKLVNAHDKIANGCAWLTEDTFVSVSRDLTLRITSAIEQQIILTPHKHSIKCIAASQCGYYIATGDYHGTVCIYDRLNESWNTHHLTTAGISCLTFDANKQIFAATSYDGNIYTVVLSEQIEDDNDQCQATDLAINEQSSREAMGLPEYLIKTNQEDHMQLYNDFCQLSIDRLVTLAESSHESLAVRMVAGQLLALRGDPRINTYAPIMVEISQAKAAIGLAKEKVSTVLEQYQDVGVKESWILKETPCFTTNIDKFYIRKYLVTNQEYRAFLLDTQYSELPSSWEFGIYPTVKANHPVYTVSAEAADTYARWLSEKTTRHFRLPTEYEWEYVAGGKQHLEYPWGGSYQADCANTLEERLYKSTPVGLFPKGNSSFGITDMAGNVEEYVLDEYHAYPGGNYINDDLASALGSYRICRGGSFARYADLARTSRRHGAYDKPIYTIGFRLVEEVRG